MKTVRSILALVVFAVSTCAFASLPEPTIMKIEVTYSDATKHIGYVETWDFLSCHPLKNSKTYYVNDGYSENSEKVTKRLTQKDLIQAFKYPDQQGIYIYENIIKLDYFPAGLKNELRLSQWAWSVKRQLVAVNAIKKISVLQCNHLEQVAPILHSMSDKDAKRLASPSLAMFADEFYPEGVVSLISYNANYDSSDKLYELLKKFSKKYPDTQPDSWFSIYSREKAFRKEFLPKDVILLIYHVQD